MIELALTVNGAVRTVEVEPRWTLADVLRDHLGLTGTKLGCEHGVCGACTVLLDGEPVRACLLLAAQAQGGSVTTVEGLSDGSLDELQEAFRRNHALQCGFCTAGFLLTATALLDEGPTLDETSVREALAGNLCRCTGYETIVQAVLEVAAR
ncbi:MAG: (2Fe-2S)-binding protein [Actinobacteria bacterium]|nr:(2Fe-2S)-binding protein [Actinomycetota bacterium]